MRTLLLSLAMASAALADEVVLRNGSSFSGIVREEGDRVVVEMDYGTMSFKKIDVKFISRGNDTLSEFNDKLKTAVDVKSLLELASWAREKGLGNRSADLYRRVIHIDPDQADARKALGYEKINGVWLQGDEIMVARGFVKVDGKWMSKEDAAHVRQLQAEARIENERSELAIKVAQMRHDEEMARIAIERDRLEAEKRGYSRWGYPTWGWGPGTCGGYMGVLMPPAVQPSMVGPTPPTVVPLTPPSVVPPSPRR